MKRPNVTLRALALVAIALLLVGLVATRDIPSPAASGARFTAARAPGDVPEPGPSTPARPPTPAPTTTASPTPPPPPPDPDPHLGVQGPQVLAIQQRLAALNYMVGTPDGNFGGATRDAVIAFEKVEKLKLTGKADPVMLARLQTATTPQPAYTTPADHLEIDIARQVVFVVRGGGVSVILATSTGSNQLFTSEGWTRRAITPNGVFHVYWKVNGWHKAPLGELYKPSFFNGGIAFHGYYSVPSYPASHGCVRLPMEFADWFYTTAAPMGATVYVYGGPNGPNPAPAPETSSETIPPPVPSPSPSPSPSPTPTPTPLPSSLLNLLLPSPTPSPTPTPSESPSLTPTPTPTSTVTPTP